MPSLMRITILRFLCCGLAWAVPAQAAAATAPAAAHHVALVIGNADYPGIAHLPTPLADARALAMALAARGNEVVLRENATAAQLSDALIRFADTLTAGGFGLVYFSGLVAQPKGIGLLLGTDAALSAPAAKEGLDLNAVYAQLAAHRLQGGLVLIDPQRLPPQAPDSEPLPPERFTLAAPAPPPGIAFAMITLATTEHVGLPVTAGGRMSPLVTQILGRIEKPGTGNLDDFLRDINVSISANGGGARVVWEATGNIGRILTARAVFGPIDVGDPAAPTVVPAHASTLAASTESDDERGPSWLGWMTRMFGGWAIFETLENLGEALLGWL